MCTIVALVGVQPDHPLILATNRDEFFARPSAAPGVLVDTPRAVGGRDLVAGGTWMGATASGLFVGVTNQRSFTPPDPAKRSRGAVVLEALRLGDADAVRRYVEGLDGREFNAFNLLWGGVTGLYAAYAREHTRALTIEAVPAGVHVLPNDVLDSPAFHKVARAKELLEDAAALPFADCLARLEGVLHDRAPADLDSLRGTAEAARLDPGFLRALSALAVVTPHYGTRSSTITAYGTDGALSHYLYADGPPGTPFVDVMPLYG
jgi:uncharacterized protein with NRDE domain